MRDHALGAIPYPVRIVVGLLVYRRIVATLHGQGTGRFTDGEIKEFKSDIWATIDGLLRESKSASAGEGPFWVLGGWGADGGRRDAVWVCGLGVDFYGVSPSPRTERLRSALTRIGDRNRKRL